MTVGSTDLGTLELGRGVSELKRRGGQVRANKKSGAGRGRRSARRRESDGARSELQRRAAREFEDQQMEGGETACTAGELLLDGVNYGEVRTLLETCIRINRMSATSVLTAPPARVCADRSTRPCACEARTDPPYPRRDLHVCVVSCSTGWKQNS